MNKFFNQLKQKPIRQTLRNRMTQAEKILWYYLRGRSLKGYKFRRQYGIGQYIVDFYCPAIRLVIEIDGDSHYRIGAETKILQNKILLKHKVFVCCASQIMKYAKD